MKTADGWAADVVAVMHFGIVAFIAVGLLLILIGMVLKWAWVRNPWFRTAHLLGIVTVAVESLCQVECPLTTLERDLRFIAGETTDLTQASFVGRLFFFNCPPENEWIFTASYVAFGLIVLSTFVLSPPHCPKFRRHVRAPSPAVAEQLDLEAQVVPSSSQ